MLLINSLAVATSLAAAAASVANAQQLFQGDSCNMQYSNFNSAPSVGDMVVKNGKVSYENGNMVLTLQPPVDGGQTGLNALVTTARSLLYGTVEARVKQSSIGGAITAFTMMNDQTKDEIDWEWVGDQRMGAWTNFFYRGIRERDPVTTYEIWSSNPSVSSDTHENFHDYKVEWTPYALTWFIDGQAVHSWDRLKTWEPAGTGDKLPFDHYHFPDTPMTISFGIWNSNEKPWADGPINWSDPNLPLPLTAQFASIKVSCYTGPFPSNATAPPNDPTASDQNGSAVAFEAQVLAVPSGFTPAPFTQQTPTGSGTSTGTGSSTTATGASSSKNGGVTTGTGSLSTSAPVTTIPKSADARPLVVGSQGYTLTALSVCLMIAMLLL